jgi:hypothetical protein
MREGVLPPPTCHMGGAARTVSGLLVRFTARRQQRHAHFSNLSTLEESGRAGTRGAPA